MGVFQIRYLYKGIVVFVAAVIFEELHGKNIIESGVLIREGNTVSLATDMLEHSKRTNPTRGKLSVLKFEVFSRELNEVSYSELLRDVISIIIVGHTLLSLDQAGVEPLT